MQLRVIFLLLTFSGCVFGRAAISTKSKLLRFKNNDVHSLEKRDVYYDTDFQPEPFDVEFQGNEGVEREEVPDMYTDTDTNSINREENQSGNNDEVTTAQPNKNDESSSEINSNSNSDSSSESNKSNESQSSSESKSDNTNNKNQVQCGHKNNNSKSIFFISRITRLISSIKLFMIHNFKVYVVYNIYAVIKKIFNAIKSIYCKIYIIWIKFYSTVKSKLFFLPFALMEKMIYITTIIPRYFFNLMINLICNIFTKFLPLSSMKKLT
ncbi:PREDICTED: cap-specific mRNA (nucleoside-2'-O-)-methyltransferase 1-like [Dinoponera quadriceps]|uniref:Cap-specific mRNA (Nucleoside-2'-O-)-methyltransferase 1-like n=1 Tax=Dinoponera quadriceps TaxID=609295 RepID=A0A6P3XB61_DINQU|nr:PREDICTED: cap-specific mRNA (nucleoside-2'-O-)-methyltransferase 1-like [Dinoponera quadriceps]